MAGELTQSLPESWRVCRLDEVATIVDSLHKTPTYLKTGRPMVRVTDVQGGFLDVSKSLRVTDEVFQEFTRRYAPKRGDIIFSRVGSYGNASFANTDMPFCLGQNTALVSPRINGRFLHFFLQSAEARRQIERAVVGSTQKTISLKSISALQVPVPPPEELEAIAHILGTLDDKIERNRRMSETLQAIARALFKSWFVDFDPVRARAEGRDPGLPQPLADLFPSSFEDSELGETPKGWGVRAVASAIEFIRGVEPGRSSCNEKGRGLRFIRVGDVTGKRSSTLYVDLVSEPRCRPGDILLALDGTPGAVAYDLDGVFSSGVRQLVSRATGLSQIYIWSLALSDSFQQTIREHARGTTIQHAGAAIEYLRDIDPGAGVMAAFSRILESPWHRLLEIHRENSVLSGIRDALLPKLISGELRVDNSGRFVQEGRTC